MKTQLLIIALITAVFGSQIQGQNRTIVNAMNSEISDNLDLRIVASVFGDSRNLEDFERSLNDPKLQISNLDLNYDGQVDYLRVIEAIEKRTHIIIIQSVQNSDLYQDVATIEIEKYWNNKVHIQVVGNSYFYGPNYIYEPIYFYTPIIYSNFWISNYRPYLSNWHWNYYPSYYYTWNTYPVFRYQNNVTICLSSYRYNDYTYVNHRISCYESTIYNSRRSNEFEKQHPNYSFSRRNTSVTNRYELDQIRESRKSSNRNEIGYSQNRVKTPTVASTHRDYSQNRVEVPIEAHPQRDYSQNRVQSPRVTPTQRDYSQNRVQTPREATPQRDYSQNRVDTRRGSASERVETSKEKHSSRNSSRVYTPNYSRNETRKT